MAQEAKQAKFAIPVRVLQRVMAITRPAIERNPTIPALAMIRIEPRDGELQFAASKESVSIRVRRALSGTQPGEPLLLPAAKLDSYARLLQGQSVSVTAADSVRATLRCDGASARLPLMKPSAYPYLEPTPDTWAVTISQASLARMLWSTTFAVSDGRSETDVRGALLEVADGKLNLVATDGHRLAHASVETSAPRFSVVLPEELLDVLARTVDDSDGTCAFAVTDARIFVSLKDSSCSECAAASIDIVQRRTPGSFPNYKAVLPTKAEAAIRVPAAQLVAALRRCVSFADSKSQAIRLSATDTELKLSGATAEGGEAIELLKVSSRNPFPPVNALFRGQYLLDVLSRVDGEAFVQFAKVGPGIALWVVHSPAPGESSEHVVMAING